MQATKSMNDAALQAVSLTAPIREGIKPPKFADRFAALDYAADPMPVIALYPMPERCLPGMLDIQVCGLDCKPQMIACSVLQQLPSVRLRAPLICQIFNWVEEVEWEGVRLVDFLHHANLDATPTGYLSVHSRDGVYFEGFSVDEVQDPRILLATGMNGQPLPHEYGGPVRLVVPFLQGYKSVKWVGAIRATLHDPVGIKRLLGQSKTGRLGRAWRKQYGIEILAGRPGDPI